MTRFKLAIVVPMLLAWCSAAAAQDYFFEGPWNTTNRKLDGIMTCAVTEMGNEKWQGRFYGVWQGVPFDYTVAFTGPPSDLQGKATIDGAQYTWKGSMTDDRFKGTFGGTRYVGYFDMKEKKPAVASTTAKQR